MSGEASIGSQFRDALIECKRLYISAAREMLDQQGEKREAVRHDRIRRMVDLHKGVAVKIYVQVAKADRHWAPEEQELARILIDHLWQQQLDGAALREATSRLFHDAGDLKWYGLVRLFDEVPVLRERVADLETVIMRLANLVAKADGRISRDEADALRGIQSEIQVLLERLPLDEADAGGTDAATLGMLATQLATDNDGHTRPRQQTAQTAQHAVEDDTPRPSLDKTLADLEKLVGLDGVKKEIRTLTNFLALQRRREEAGLPRHELSLHMIFMGNPGTGKTTVARIVGRVFNALNLLKKGHLVETDRSGLVAEYAGQTGPKTHRKVDEALDGVLFIDEAYSLIADSAEDPYGQEAVQALIKRMEDDRDRLVLILAGYPEPMQRLVQSNPGMSSRFNTRIVFDDYAPVDLSRICARMCATNQYELPAATRAKLLLGFQWLFARRDQHFGNGRLVRNVFEHSVRRLANRVADTVPVTRELLTVLTPGDIHMDDVPDLAWEPLKTGDVRFIVDCRNCGRFIKLKAGRLGTSIRCPACQHAFTADWGTPRLKHEK